MPFSLTIISFNCFISRFVPSSFSIAEFCLIFALFKFNLNKH
jgi:hypothetical protein